MEMLQEEATFQRGNENPAIRSLMTKLDQLIAQTVEVRQACVPLMSVQADGCVMRTRAELLDHRARLFATDSHCHYCEQELNFSQCTLDHVRPKSRGGDDSDENLVLSCDKCNQLKGSLLECEFRSAIDAGHVELPQLAVVS